MKQLMFILMGVAGLFCFCLVAGCTPGEKFPEPAEAVLPETMTDEPEEMAVYEAFSGDTVRIANWNLHIFGKTKAADAALMAVYADIIDDYDIIFVQEIRDKSQTAFESLCALLEDYDCMVSSRAGRSPSKEQYGVICRNGIEIVEFADLNPDTADRWERPPVAVTFSIGGYPLTVYNIHTKPDDADSEISHLEDVVTAGGNVVVMGDLNADCDYYEPTTADDFIGWHWLIEDEQDTTVAATDCAYDRIILNEDTYEEYINSGIYTAGIVPAVSDHYLVWVELQAKEE